MENEVLSDLKEAALPLIKHLNENHNPHTIAIVGTTSVEVLSDKASLLLLLSLYSAYREKI